MLFSSIGQTVGDLVLLWYMGIGEEMMVPFQKKGEEMMEERGKKIIGHKRIPKGFARTPLWVDLGLFNVGSNPPLGNNQWRIFYYLKTSDIISK